MNIVELERLKVDDMPTGVCSEDGELAFSTAEHTQLYSLARDTQETTESFDVKTFNPVGLSRYGNEVYYLDAGSKTVYKTAADRYAPEKVLDLNTLDLSGSHPALQARDTQVTDLFVAGKTLLCSVEAGYGSGVYEINLETKKVERFFFSNGPQPHGVAQDRETHKIYVADAGQGYLVEFSPEGKLTGETAKLPTDRPYGLDVDAEGNFYVGAQDTREVVRFRVKEAEQ